MLHRWLAAALLTTSALAAPMAAAQTNETRLLRDPALSDEALAFVYAGDIWIAAAAARAGAPVLTYDPHFSLIARVGSLTLTRATD